ncbi:MAG: hypothetical protein Kow002_05690 [Anaerolineales bacterium]
MKKLAVFDLDGTLYDGNIITGYLLHHRKHRVNRLPLYTYFASHSILIPLWKLGVLSEVTTREMWARDLSWATVGMSEESGRRCFEWIGSNYVIPLIRNDVFEWVGKHSNDGYQAILVSGTPSPLLEIIANKLGFHEFVGTPLKVANGNYTGRIELPTAQGKGKVERLKRHLGTDVNDVDWKSSFAYSDSITDEPLLGLFGNPIAVYPDPKLAGIARKSGWTILGEIRDPQKRKMNDGIEKVKTS